MKIWIKQNELIADDNERTDGSIFVCDKNITRDELKFYKVNASGNDIVIDVVKQNNRKSELIKSQSDDGGLIDKKTVSLLSQGFSHPSHPEILFSLSEAAQISLIALNVKKDSIPYPWPLSILGGGYYNIANAAELDSIAMAALSRVATVKKIGNDKKLWIRDNLRTLADIENFVDDRV